MDNDMLIEVPPVVTRRIAEAGAKLIAHGVPAELLTETHCPNCQEWPLVRGNTTEYRLILGCTGCNFWGYYPHEVGGILLQKPY